MLLSLGQARFPEAPCCHGAPALSGLGELHLSLCCAVTDEHSPAQHSLVQVCDLLTGLKHA